MAWSRRRAARPGAATRAYMRHVTGERAALLGWALLLATLTTAPYFWVSEHADRYAPYEAEYCWILPPYPQDSLSYAAWVEQAARGKLLFRVQYTSLEHRPAVFHPFFLMVGWLSAASGLPPSQALLVAKAIGVVAFIVAFWWLCRMLPLSQRQRWIALLLVGVCSGTGALARRWVPASADLWIPEIDTLWSLVWNPLFTFSLVVIVVAVGALQRFGDGGRRAWLVVAGLLTALLAFVHPYEVAVLGVLGVFVVLTREPLRALPGSLAAFVAPAAPAIAVQGFLSATHPVLAAHSQAVMASPSPLAYLSGLGLPLVFFGVGTWVLLRQRLGRRMRLLLFWPAAAAVLVYAPVWFQRRLIMGVQLPICLVAAVGIDALAQCVAPRRRPAYIVLVGAIVAATTITHLHNAWAVDQAMRRDPRAYFLPLELVEALDFLAADSRPEDRVLAHSSVAIHIPGRTGNGVTTGHWAQSVDQQEHERWLRFLFARGDDARDPERLESLERRRIEYVFVDPAMRVHWLHNRIPAWLERRYDVVFRNSAVTILRVPR